VETPTSSELLEAWDAGSVAGRAAKAISLLFVACPGEAPEVLASLTVGEREARLLELRARIFGSLLVGLVSCPACASRLEVEVHTDELRSFAPAGRGEVETLRVGAWEARFRIPTSRDLAAIESQRDAASAEQLLLAACVVEVKHEAAVVDVADVPTELATAIGERMADADPLAAAEVGVDCPECGHSWRAPFDIAAFLWSEVDAWAKRTLRDVHDLARAYSWTEEQVLALSLARRSRYLQMVLG
jgi:hypothetical protein